MANLQSQIDILGKAIVREHIKRVDDKTEMIAINDKMLQSHFNNNFVTNNVTADGTTTTTTTTTLTLHTDPHVQSHLSAALVNRNIKTGKTNEVGVYQEASVTNGDETTTELLTTTITSNESNRIKFHVEDDDSHHVNGFMVIDDEKLSIKDKSIIHTFEHGEGEQKKEASITKTLKYIGSSEGITPTTENSYGNIIYIIDSKGNIIANTSTTTSSINTEGTITHEVKNVTFDKTIGGGMYRLADLNSDYSEGGQHEVNFINIGISTETTGTENQGEEVQG